MPAILRASWLFVNNLVKNENVGGWRVASQSPTVSQSFRSIRYHEHANISSSLLPVKAAVRCYLTGALHRNSFLFLPRHKCIYFACSSSLTSAAPVVVIKKKRPAWTLGFRPREDEAAKASNRSRIIASQPASKRL